MVDSGPYLEAGKAQFKTYFLSLIVFVFSSWTVYNQVSNNDKNRTTMAINMLKNYLNKLTSDTLIHVELDCPYNAEIESLKNIVVVTVLSSDVVQWKRRLDLKRIDFKLYNERHCLSKDSTSELTVPILEIKVNGQTALIVLSVTLLIVLYSLSNKIKIAAHSYSNSVNVPWSLIDATGKFHICLMWLSFIPIFFTPLIVPGAIFLVTITETRSRGIDLSLWYYLCLCGLSLCYVVVTALIAWQMRKDVIHMRDIKKGE